MWLNGAILSSSGASGKPRALQCIHRRHFATHTEVYDAVADYIDNFYNPRRLHSSNDYLSPMHAELQLAQAMAA